MNYRLAIIAVLLLAGCAHFHDQPLSADRTAASIEARRLDSPDFRRFLETNFPHSHPEWPPKVWDFDLLTLAALYYHPSLDVARAQWAVAEGGDKTAAQRPNPVLSAVPGYSFDPTAASGPPTPWTPAVSLDIPIETAGKRGYRMAQAARLSEAARLNIATTAWQVRGNLRTSLIDLVGARRREDLLVRQLAVQDEIVTSLEQRAEAGAIARSEVALVRIARDKVRLDMSDALRLAAEARVRVADAIGVPVAALERVDLPDDFTPAPSADELTAVAARRQALIGRADILGALAEYAASQSALQLEIAKQYPDIHLSPNYNYDQNNQKVAIGLTVDLPVLSQNQGPIAEAVARRSESAARFNALQAKVITEIDAAVASYRAVKDQMATLDGLVAAQQKQRDTVKAQIDAGAMERLDLLNSLVELGASELSRQDAQAKLQQALGALEDAMQRPIETLKPSLFESSQRSLAVKEKKP